MQSSVKPLYQRLIHAARELVRGGFSAEKAADMVASAYGLTLAQRDAICSKILSQTDLIRNQASRVKDNIG